MECSDTHTALTHALREAVLESRSPGAIALVGDQTTTVFHEAFGMRQLRPKLLPARKETPYDLASLTKVVATATAVLLLRDEGKLDIDAPVFGYVPIPGFDRFTMRQCLTHTAGLVPGKPYYKEASSLNQMLQRYAERELEFRPGTRRVYSDVGFMILGKVVEMVAQQPLDQFCAQRIFTPLGMARTAFNPPKDWAATCAATEHCAWRRCVMIGAVHDENAYAVGGVAGHAGLFGTAADLARFCRGLLGGRILRHDTVAEIARVGQVPVFPWQGLGWNVDPWASGTEGFLPARTAIGHTGWTGTSIWMDVATGRFVILLSNTCHPSRKNRHNGTLRGIFHQSVARRFYPEQSNTHTGLDRLVWSGFRAVQGQRLGLLTNQAGVDQLSRPLLQVLALEPAAKIHIVFSPEHGFRGQAEAGEAVASEAGSVRVVSLYGKRKRPSAAELAEISLFVIDLPDVGSRYYTYMATMLECLRACAEAGKPVLVLDRPNPVGGAVLEGPVAEQTGSDVCCAPIPVRHGMTMGELALFFSKTLLADKKLKLSVSGLDNWSPDRLFDRCALPWTPPSPNIPTAQTALLYVGLCLFEGTNLNEGRGTDIPFHVVGAPWLDAASVITQIPPEEHVGCVLKPALYVPKPIPGKASHPRFEKKLCRGVQVSIEDPAKVRSFTLALALLGAIRRLHPNQFQWNDRFDVLAGTPKIRAAIERGEGPAQITAAFAPGLDAFNRARPRLYAEEAAAASPETPA